MPRPIIFLMALVVTAITAPLLGIALALSDAPEWLIYASGIALVITIIAGAARRDWARDPVVRRGAAERLPRPGSRLQRQP